MSSGVSSKINFPSSNVLQFITEDGSKISVRPSGTEPKIKFYFSVNTKVEDLSKYDQTVSDLKNKTDKIMEEFNNEVNKEADLAAVGKGAIANPNLPKDIQLGRSINEFVPEMIRPLATIENTRNWRKSSI